MCIRGTRRSCVVCSCVVDYQMFPVACGIWHILNLFFCEGYFQCYVSLYLAFPLPNTHKTIHFLSIFHPISVYFISHQEISFVTHNNSVCIITKKIVLFLKVYNINHLPLSLFEILFFDSFLKKNKYYNNSY